MSEIVPLTSIPLGKEVDIKNLSSLLQTFSELEKVCKRENGIGLSAVQIGLPLNLFVVKFDYNSKFGPFGKFGYFLNCKYEPIGEDFVKSTEGCLSIRDNGKLKFFELERHKTIRLIGKRFFVKKDVFLSDIDVILEYNSEGIVFQHEIDHQNGILISDRGRNVV